MGEKIFKHTIAADFVDALGHVNNAKVLTLLEMARWDVVGAHGFTPETIQQLGVAPVILEIHIRYLKEMLAGQEIAIRSQLLSYDKKIGKLAQTITRTEDGVQTADAVVTFGLFDLQARKLVAPTEEWMSALS
ncbi:MAG: thioesterase family protein [Zetaproteobacteria bacterium]|nr:thioesterase family protein [Zetaproteobacteria bacterium]